MGEFKAITTQEEFDAAIKDRITRAEQTAENRVRAEMQKELEEVNSLKSSVTSLTSERDSYKKQAEENAEEVKRLKGEADESAKKLKTYETDALKLKIAQETGIPISERGRLTGETEEEIRIGLKLSEVIGRKMIRKIESYK